MQTLNLSLRIHVLRLRVTGLLVCSLTKTYVRAVASLQMLQSGTVHSCNACTFHQYCLYTRIPFKVNHPHKVKSTQWSLLPLFSQHAEQRIWGSAVTLHPCPQRGPCRALWGAHKPPPLDLSLALCPAHPYPPTSKPTGNCRPVVNMTLPVSPRIM